MILPAKSLFGEFVYVVTDGVVQQRKVETGARNLRTIEIVDGLKLGEQVIIDPPHLFNDGNIKFLLLKKVPGDDSSKLERYATFRIGCSLCDF